MKRTIVLFTVLLMLVSFTSCGRTGEQGGTAGNGGDVAVENDVTHDAADNTRETVAEPVTGGSTEVRKTADEAKGIAFTHAGVSEADVRDLEVELDREGDREYYDIDFKVERMEYSYDIDAVSGKILKSDKHMD